EVLDGEVHYRQSARLEAFAWRAVTRGCDYSNDSDGHSVLVGFANRNWVVDLFADGTLPREKSFGGSFLDDHDELLPGDVVRIKSSSAQDRHFEHAKVIR